MDEETLPEIKKEHDKFNHWFAIVITMITLTYMFAITFFNIPEANQRYADTILGFLLGTTLAQIISFFYGSSASSQKKDIVIAASLPKRNDNIPIL